MTGFVITERVECMMLDELLSLLHSSRVSWTLARLWWCVKSCLRMLLSCVANIVLPDGSFGMKVERKDKHSW